MVAERLNTTRNTIYKTLHDALVITLPVTTTDRSWPSHIRVDGPSGLDRPSWIMTEQPRTFSRDRITGIAGRVSSECLTKVRTWLADFLDL